MNGLDDYKNILSGGIRLVQTGVVPTFGSTVDTPTVPLKPGEAFTTSRIIIYSSQDDGTFWIHLTESSTFYVFTIVDSDSSSRGLESNYGAYYDYPLYRDIGANVFLKGYRRPMPGSNGYFACFYETSWLVLRIA